MATTLPGVVSAYTFLPVLEYYCKVPDLTGVDALFPIVRMPPALRHTVTGKAGSNVAVLAAMLAPFGKKWQPSENKVINYLVS